MRQPPIALLFAAILVGGCGQELTEMVDAAPADLAPPALRDFATSDGGGPVFAELTMVGCATLGFVGDVPRCSGSAPLVLTLVPVAATSADTWLWSCPGADPSTSTVRTPTVAWRTPGTWSISLVVSGPSGSATASGVVIVAPAPTGAPCDVDDECESGYSCVCPGPPPSTTPIDAGLVDGAPDDAPPIDGGTGDSSVADLPLVDAGVDAGPVDARPVVLPDLGAARCPSALAAGMCTRACDTSGCSPGEVCVDLGRAVAADPSLTSSPWRRALCLPSCATDATCRPGFHCRTLPGLAAIGPNAWVNACFVGALLGDVGAACDDAAARPQPAACATGDCTPLGARGSCSLDCTSASCPPNAVCAHFSSTLGVLCLARCDATHPCPDPLLACQVADPTGALGFTVPTTEPTGSTYCAPRRCTHGPDCAPAGACDAPDGGAGFCHR